VTLKGQSRDPNIFGAQYLEKRLEIESSNLVCRFASGAQIIFPESGHGLGHLTPTIFGGTVGFSSNSLASCFSKNHLAEICTLTSAF